jgi:hypothetical protein
MIEGGEHLIRKLIQAFRDWCQTMEDAKDEK